MKPKSESRADRIARITAAIAAGEYRAPLSALEANEWDVTSVPDWLEVYLLETEQWGCWL